jgi:membrane-associated phospholipid phosphatase
MFLPSFLVFLFFPVALPRGAEVSSDPFMQWIIRHDGRFNCFPSLHAAFLAYSSGLAWRMFGKAWSGWVIGLVGVWGGLILYSTLATKQHYAWDLVAGLVLGWIACVVAWRGAPENSIEITARMRDSTAHEGLR